ncbi:hypothetical protein [Serratia fonticola]|uniref:hypothetical protein n=1 Tax=Serratia fonticola TaxID=47917 RepID=UPI002177C579|nr:hypothetical protein [Serratia fonticola]CAI0877423.1 Uncharacterised protein [Serratia fonticola]CAI0912067.1 Uncharacterised protein [Serratia fonticola]
MNSIKNTHELVLENFGMKYFQNCDYEGRFPNDYFDALKSNDALYHLINDYESVCSFSEIASLIGKYSISASLCWVMHNQQSNAIHQLNHPLYCELLSKQCLIASVTSEYGERSCNALTELDNGLRVERQAPVCSYRTHADFFIVSMRHKDLTSSERYLILLPKESITPIDGFHLTSTRSTCSGPINIDILISPQQVIGKLSAVFSSVFVPIGHIGWMSSYHGGLSGVLSKVRSSIRDKNSTLKKKTYGELFCNRIAQAIALEYINECLICDVMNKIYGISDGYSGLPLNIIKTEVSRNIRNAACLLEDALGSKYIMTPFDELGAEIFCRDARSASLMVHNDMFYRDIFDLWLLKR